MRQPAAFIDAAVFAIRPENALVTTVIYDTDDDALRHFTPGQFASLRLPEGDGWSAPHPFTLSGATGQKPQMTIKSVGPFTTERIPRLTAGAPVRLAGPFGNFLASYSASESAVLLAGGVGITPFLSVLRSQAGSKGPGPKSVRLFWGLASMEEAFAASELEELTRRIPLRVVYVLNRQPDSPQSDALFAATPDAAQSAAMGFVCADLLSRYSVSPAADFYLCGPPPMHHAVLAELTAFNVDASHIQTERFGPPEQPR